VPVEIQVQDLSVTLSAGTARARRVLDHVALRIPPASICAVIGRSGCGKTTLLKSIGGLLDESRVELQGHVRFRSDLGERAEPNVGMVFQRSFLLPWRTALQNVALHDRLRTRPQRDRAHVEALLARVGLADHAWKYPHELSDGMQQRVALAREFARPLDVLLMDEPFRQLDCVTQEQLLECLLMFWREHQTTIVIVTHDPSEAVLLADQVVVVDHGRIAATLDVSARLAGVRGRQARMSPQYPELLECIHTLVRGSA
jgi:ABC-type nitrate/sulfonate/bicarbonate transport system ATPase subunit